jgi:ribose transport system ATP-binding protein
VGLAGLVGSGRTEIINILYGLDKKDSGDVRLNGKIVNISSPKIAIKNKIGLIPEDRKDLGLILGQEVYKNSTAIQIDKMKSNGFINTNKEIDFAEKAVDQLSIKVNNVGQKVRELSGGNQQKVVVSKWLGQDLDLIIYDEPTKGIDISAKEDIFRNIEDLSEKGIGVIFISSDIEEVIRISDRVLVVRDGTIIDTMKNDNITVQDIMNKIFNVE